jgi:hypothetical protein
LRIEEKLERILRRLQAINSATHQGVRGGPEHTPNEKPVGELNHAGFQADNYSVPRTRTFREEFVESYNRAREDREARNTFWNKYQAIQIGNRNASEQRMGRTTVTDFRTSDVGDFIGILNSGAETYLVVPNFSLFIDDTSFRYGGVEAAFECDFLPGSSYQRFQVIAPAEFTLNDDKWSLRTEGRLLLSQ